MKKSLLSIFALSLAAFASQAEVVILHETFDARDYTKSFPYVYDGDNLEPHNSVKSLFLSASSGTYQPWWILQDTSTSPNYYYGSHSYYAQSGQSNDWFVSVPLEIPTAGYNLTFDAQSFTFNMDDSKLSSLWLYITEELLDPNNLPTEPVAVWENIPQGATDAVDNEFTHYKFNLDAYAGKTIYLNFANQNTDKEILCLDNIKVAYESIAELEIGEYENMTANENFEFDVTIETTSATAINNWSIEVEFGDELYLENGETLEGNSSLTKHFSCPMEIDRTYDFTVTLIADEQEAITKKGSVSRLAFNPFRKVLVEESTGSWCSWCPGAAYNVEEMQADEEMSQYVVPVAVHAYGAREQMVIQEYDNALGCDAAPMFRINRSTKRYGMTQNDYTFDKNDPTSFAYAVAQEHKKVTPVEVDVTGDWVIEGNDTTQIKCKAVVRPALSTKDFKYRVGFILTENNVYNKDDGNWAQTNGFSGQALEGNLRGWALLPSSVRNFRYNDVARGIWDFNGLASSLPEEMIAGEEYEFEYTIDIPDTETTSGSGKIMRPAIKTEYCELICFVIDKTTGEIMNVDAYPMSDVASNRFTVIDLCEELGIQGATGVEQFENTEDGPTTYFDLQGRQIENPEKGIYIKRVGNTTSKVVIK